MVTKYVGVFCARCKRFLVVSTHQVERPEMIGAHLDLSPVTNLRCDSCDFACGYRMEDVAHSLSLDGSQPQYPNRH